MSMFEDSESNASTPHPKAKAKKGSKAKRRRRPRPESDSSSDPNSELDPKVVPTTRPDPGPRSDPEFGSGPPPRKSRKSGKSRTECKPELEPEPEPDPPQPQSDPEPEPDPQPEPESDPFDPEALRLSQDFNAAVGVKRIITTVRCDKPHRQVFVRVKPGEANRLETGIFEDKINQGERYLIDRGLWPELADEISPVCLLTAITKQGDIFLWPVKLPGSDGRSNDWNSSALITAELAETRWVRMAANMMAGCYDTFEATGELAEPVWPDLTLQEILKLCFKERFIRALDHPVLRALRGEV